MTQQYKKEHLIAWLDDKISWLQKIEADNVEAMKGSLEDCKNQLYINIQEFNDLMIDFEALRAYEVMRS